MQNVLQVVAIGVVESVPVIMFMIMIGSIAHAVMTRPCCEEYRRRRETLGLWDRLEKVWWGIPGAVVSVAATQGEFHNEDKWALAVAAMAIVTILFWKVHVKRLMPPTGCSDHQPLPEPHPEGFRRRWLSMSPADLIERSVWFVLGCFAGQFVKPEGVRAELTLIDFAVLMFCVLVLVALRFWRGRR